MSGFVRDILRTLRGWETETRVIAGIPVHVVNTRADIDTNAVFARIERVLALIERYQPRRLRRLRRDVSRIQVERFACRGAFFPEQRACLCELTFTVNPEFTDAQVASSIVHEGVHARVHAMGVIPTDDPMRRAREERVCRRAELDFGVAVQHEPGGEAVVRRALESLALDDRDVAPTANWDAARAD